MHVLLVTTSYPDSNSGSEAAGGFVEEFAHQLARHMRVTVVAAAARKSSVCTEGPLQVYRFGVPRWPLSLLNPLSPADWLPIYATLRGGQRKVREVVETDRPDYIFALWALPSGYWARGMLESHGIPYGVWALGSDIWSLGRIPFVRSYLRNILVSAEHRYADGMQLGRAVAELSDSQCEFLPSARQMPAQPLAKPAESSPYRLAFLGRWHPNKGVDLFLEALTQLSKDDWARISEVRVRGGGTLEADVHRMVGRLQARGHPVEVGGYLDTAGAIDLITWSDYLVLPSRVESIPVVFSDAAQLGRPMIATPVGDLPSLFEQYEFGVLAGEVTSGAIAEALRRALRISASRFHERLYALSKQFDISLVADKFAGRLEALNNT